MEGLPNRNFRNISNSELSDLGLKIDNIHMVETIEDLRKTKPNIVIAECTKTVQFKQNSYKRSQDLIKRTKYLMALGIYHQLYYDTRINQRILKPSGIKFEKL